jgi:hypothetical protein
MLLKIYYENEEEESFLALVAAFSKFLQRNKLISKDHFTLYSNLLKFSKKAFALKTLLPYQKKKNYELKVKALKDKILHTRKTININWLLREVEKL